MQSLKQLLKEKYQLTNYQIAQLDFLRKTFFSESSKVFIMGIIFYKNLPLYLFALFIMSILRCSTGGIHFYTYAGCFITSLLFLWLCIKLLPYIFIPLNFRITALLICMFICYCIGPVASKYRPPFSKNFIKKCKIIISVFILFYTLILYIMPESQYLIVGFWIVILHTLQLLIAKIIKKGGIVKS